jgi:8-hydroxy-5-deazaflavin:NADPH oxidoreductase
MGPTGRSPRGDGPIDLDRTRGSSVCRKEEREERRVKISVLGTGVVGRALAGRLAGLGHEVVVGTRDPDVTLARTEPDRQGTPPYAQWQEQNPAVRLVSLADAGTDAELLVNATAGAASVDALAAAGVADRNGLVVLDVANPLVFSADGPALSVANTDSLAETLQRAFPNARIVKSLNTMNAAVMVDPGRVPGDHVVFVAGDDVSAKETVTGLLRELGWDAGRVVDLGGLTAARGAEMFVLLWWSMTQSFGTYELNIGVNRA